MSTDATCVRPYRADEAHDLIGTTRAMIEIREEIARAARCDAKVLITGESGTGKEVIARLIHQQSRRAHRPFVALNCGALADSILESELFGHARGSFTGADRERMGHLERAHRGTAFLDEIGEMSPRMQAALLRFLETGEIHRVGADRSGAALDVRVISATNRDLLASIRGKEFREDLFYRLNVIHIDAPPLRDRRDDIPALLEHFAGIFANRHRLARPRFSFAALAALQRYEWPGNVRELRNIVERLVIYSRDGEIGPSALPEELTRGSASRAAADPQPAASRTRGDEIFTRLRIRRESFWTAVYAPFMSRDLTRSDVQQIVTRGLRETRGNYRSLVTLLNMPAADYKRFLNFLKKHSCHVAFQPFRLIEPDAIAAMDAA